MKRTLSLLLVIIICFTAMPVVSFAVRDVSYEESLAQELKELGLFKGVSDTNFDLSRAPSRVEALVMLIRTLGKENDALNGTWRHPFDDVPKWADKYVGYAYVNSLTNGQSATKFGSGNANAAMFVTFVLRALGYSDTNGADFVWSDPFTLARQIGILNDKVNLEEFWRSDVVLVAHASLSAYIKGTDTTLAQKLISQGVFTSKKFDSSYGYTDKLLALEQTPQKELTSEQIYAKCSPAVFYIEVKNEYNITFANGSGFFINDKGLAVTNYHVIEGASSAVIQTSDSKETFEILGIYDYDIENDWAIIQVDCKNNKYLEIGDTSTVVGAATIYAIGSPRGFQNTISQGLISNPERILGNTKYIQISAAISSGSSGGALINKYGQVIGITSAGYDNAQNLNLAIPMTALSDYDTQTLISLKDLVKQRKLDAYHALRQFVDANGEFDSKTGTTTLSYVVSSNEDWVNELVLSCEDGYLDVHLYSTEANGWDYFRSSVGIYPYMNIYDHHFVYCVATKYAMTPVISASSVIPASVLNINYAYAFDSFSAEGNISKSSTEEVALGMLCSSLEATDLVFDLIYEETGLIYSISDLGFIMM